MVCPSEVIENCVCAVKQPSRRLSFEILPIQVELEDVMVELFDARETLDQKNLEIKSLQESSQVEPRVVEIVKEVGTFWFYSLYGTYMLPELGISPRFLGKYLLNYLLAYTNVKILRKYYY